MGADEEEGAPHHSGCARAWVGAMTHRCRFLRSRMTLHGCGCMVDAADCG